MFKLEADHGDFDPAFPKVTFPSHAQCTRCYPKEGAVAKDITIARSASCAQVVLFCVSLCLGSVFGEVQRVFFRLVVKPVKNAIAILSASSTTTAVMITTRNARRRATPSKHLLNGMNGRCTSSCLTISSPNPAPPRRLPAPWLPASQSTCSWRLINWRNSRHVSKDVPV